MLARGRYVVPLVLFGGLAVFGVRWYLDCPRDLRLEGIDVGQIAQYADLKKTPQQDHYVARISFTSGKDLRKMMLAEDGGAGTDVIAKRCDCNEEEMSRSGENCRINLGPFPFDHLGDIQKYYDVRPERTSRLAPDKPRTLYHFYVPLEQWGSHDRPYDLTARPVDLCVQITRYGFFEPTRKSNVMFVPKEKVAAAIMRERVP